MKMILKSIYVQHLKYIKLFMYIEICQIYALLLFEAIRFTLKFA